MELSGTARILDWTGSLVTTRPTAPCDAITQLSFRFSALVLGLSALQLSVDIAKEVTGASGASGMLEAQPSYRRRTAALRPGWFTIALCSLGRAGWHMPCRPASDMLSRPFRLPPPCGQPPAVFLADTSAPVGRSAVACHQFRFSSRLEWTWRSLCASLKGRNGKREWPQLQMPSSSGGAPYRSARPGPWPAFWSRSPGGLAR